MIKIFCFSPHAMTVTKTKSKNKNVSYFVGKMLPAKSNVNLIYKNFPFSLACQMESVKIYTEKILQGGGWGGGLKNLNNIKLANGSRNCNKYPIKLCSKSKAQTKLANKTGREALLGGVGSWWVALVLVASNKKTFRLYLQLHGCPPLTPSPSLPPYPASTLLSL